MRTLSRRSFLITLSGISFISGWIVQRPLFSKTCKDSPVELFQKLLSKKQSLKSISYSVLKTTPFSSPQTPSDGWPAQNMKYDVVSDFRRLKVTLLIPTEKTPGGWGARFTYIWRDGVKYEIRESLDGSFADDSVTRKFKAAEESVCMDFLDEIFPVPQNKLMSSSGNEILGEKACHIISQGDRKYWIFPEGPYVLKKEMYRDSVTPFKTVEYRRQFEYQNGIMLPSLVVEKTYDADGNLLEECFKDISRIVINSSLSDSVFAHELKAQRYGQSSF